MPFKIVPTIPGKYQIKEQTHDKNPNKWKEPKNQRCIEQLRRTNRPTKLNIYILYAFLFSPLSLSLSF